MHVPVVKGDLSPAPPKYAKKDAPYMSGELNIGGKTALIHLLVDTGADSTMLNGALVANCHELWPAGEEEYAHGVGGDWPIRRFKNLTLTVLADNNQDRLLLELPIVTVAAPFVLKRRTGDTKVFFNEPGPGMGKVDKNENPNLLGRDVFVKNRLRLVWDPEAASRIELIVPPTAPAVAAAAPQQAGP